MNTSKIARRVAASFITDNAADTESLGALSRRAKEFNTKEELEQYLKDHPKADKSKHTVKGQGGQDKGKGDPGKAPAKGKPDDKGGKPSADAGEGSFDGKSVKIPESIDDTDVAFFVMEEAKTKQEAVDAVEEALGKAEILADSIEENLENQKKMLQTPNQKNIVTNQEVRLRNVKLRMDGYSELLSALGGGSGPDGNSTPDTDTKPANPHQKKSVGPKTVSKVKNVMDAHSLSADDNEMKELAGFKSTLGQRIPEKDVGKWYVRNVPKLKADFLKNMSPSNYESPEAFKAAKERMKAMPVGDLAKILAAITD